MSLITLLALWLSYHDFTVICLGYHYDVSYLFNIMPPLWISSLFLVYPTTEAIARNNSTEPLYPSLRGETVGQPTCLSNSIVISNLWLIMNSPHYDYNHTSVIVFHLLLPSSCNMFATIIHPVYNYTACFILIIVFVLFTGVILSSLSGKFTAYGECGNLWINLIIW